MKKYTTPYLNIIRLASEDIMAGSGEVVPQLSTFGGKGTDQNYVGGTIDFGQL